MDSCDSLMNEIDRISSLREAEDLSLRISKLAQRDLDVEYPEASAYIEAVGAYLTTYDKFHETLDLQQVKVFCRVMLGGLYFE
ncbi:hypothetical protein shim_30450 [Shimia sp. SK013]|nr:hypothetical protein shim_30450 [Shimia sp. SK013]